MSILTGDFRIIDKFIVNDTNLEWLIVLGPFLKTYLYIQVEGFIISLINYLEPPTSQILLEAPVFVKETPGHTSAIFVLTSLSLSVQSCPLLTATGMFECCHLENKMQNNIQGIEHFTKILFKWFVRHSSCLPI